MKFGSNGFVENTLEEYRNETDTKKQTEIKDGAYDQWLGYLVMRQCDQKKYGTVLTGLTGQ